MIKWTVSLRAELAQDRWTTWLPLEYQLVSSELLLHQKCHQENQKFGENNWQVRLPRVNALAQPAVLTQTLVTPVPQPNSVTWVEWPLASLKILLIKRLPVRKKNVGLPVLTSRAAKLPVTIPKTDGLLTASCTPKFPQAK